jgi:dihydroorotate dehydrogenase electron transfer subunit
MHLLSGTVSRNEKVRGLVYRMSIRAPLVARNAAPGQFVMLRPGRGTDPLLRRPFSIHSVRGGELLILYRVAGRGTEKMSEMAPGTELSVFGPLGAGFRPVSDAKRHIALAGGMGVAPILFLAERFTKEGLFREDNAKVVLGARTADEIYSEDEFRALPCTITVATDDGSRGIKGTALALLSRILRGSPAGSAVYACGPPAMIRHLARLMASTPDAACQVSVEERMACGMGVCRGCVVKVADPGGDPRWAATCTQGPVFNISELIFEDP